MGAAFKGKMNQSVAETRGSKRFRYDIQHSAARNNNAALIKNSKHSAPCTNTETLNYTIGSVHKTLHRM